MQNSDSKNGLDVVAQNGPISDINSDATFILPVAKNSILSLLDEFDLRTREIKELKFIDYNTQNHTIESRIILSVLDFRLCEYELLKSDISKRIDYLTHIQDDELLDELHELISLKFILDDNDISLEDLESEIQLPDSKIDFLNYLKTLDPEKIHKISSLSPFFKNSDMNNVAPNFKAIV